MSVTLKSKYSNSGGQSGTYEHSTMPAVVISRTAEYKEDTTEVVKYIEQWEITGLLIPDDSMTISEQIDELRAHYENNTITEMVISDSSEGILSELPKDNGIKVLSIEFPEGSGPEWATKRTYTITVEGIDVRADSDTKGIIQYRIEYSTEQNGLQTRTISGTVRDLIDFDAITKFENLKTDKAWIPWALANPISSSYSTNDTGSLCEFSLVHKKYFEAFPSGITNASVSTTLSTDSQGVVRNNISGWFEGGVSSCNNAIDALRPSDSVLISETITRDDYSNRTNFNMQYISYAINDILFQSETISITEPHADWVFKRVLGGLTPIKQNTSLTTATARQTGEIKRLSSYPVAPAARFSTAYMRGPTITKKDPEYKVGAGYVYSLSYSYEFEFPTSPGWPV